MNVTQISRRVNEVRVARVVLAVVVIPLYVVGFLAAFLYLAAQWAIAAAGEGFDAGRRAVAGSRSEAAE